MAEQTAFFLSSTTCAWSLGEAVCNRLIEKEQIMLDAINNHVPEALPASNEDLEIIFSKFH